MVYGKHQFVIHVRQPIFIMRTIAPTQLFLFLCKSYLQLELQRIPEPQLEQHPEPEWQLERNPEREPHLTPKPYHQYQNITF